MDGLAGDAPHFQQPGQPVGHVLRVAKGDGPVIAAVVDQGGHGVQLLLPSHQLNGVLLDIRAVLLHRADGDLRRVALINPGNIHNFP